MDFKLQAPYSPTGDQPEAIDQICGAFSEGTKCVTLLGVTGSGKTFTMGLKCTAGKVNGKIVPIREKLKTGDVVEIITNKNQKPSGDWLNFVVTGKARSKIRQKLKEEEFKLASAGKEMIDRRLKNSKLELPDEMMNRITKKFNYKTINEFYAAVGNGTVDFAQVKDYILAGPEGPKISAVDDKVEEDTHG